ncbi:MAG: GIY-YIG nuclease family protein [Novosphingobium sp.]|nr:GIY-YIG nuclease family protein [Novosphingobium sp.]
MERLEPSVAAVLSALGGDAKPVTASDARSQGWPGSYALLIELESDLAVRFAGHEGRLDAGWYAYAGSARGPGGVGARIARHLSGSKKPHWHVDALTLVARRIDAIATRDLSECEIAVRLAASNSFAHVLPGFGSSDCRTCVAHLLAWQS